MDFGAAARQVLKYLAENPLARGFSGGQTRPYSDPGQHTQAHKLSFGMLGRLCLGTITDTTALGHAYRVSVEKGVAPVVATPLTHSSLTNLGARSIATYPAGTSVLLFIHDQLDHALILGACPWAMRAANTGLADQITQASRTRVDAAHREPYKLAVGDIQAWPAGRPFDGLTGGEQGWITNTGLRITVDDFMAQLGTGEACGIMAFYHDDLLRIAAYNLQQWTAGSELEALNDQGEFARYHGQTPYPWEQLGLLLPGDAIKEYSAEETQLTKPYYSRWEPRQDHQLPFHRAVEFGGYLGQGGKRLVQLPPTGATYWQYAGGQDSSTSNDKGGIGVFEENIGLDGRAFTRTAKGWVVCKGLGFPAPKRLRKAEDGTGDTPDNYKFAGQEGNGKEHKITGDIETKGDEPGMNRLMGLLDLHTYLFNYAGEHPFHFHEKDWQLDEEDKVLGEQTIPPAPTFHELASRGSLSHPSPIRLKVDHRYGEQDYYPGESFFGLLDDGAMAQGCGYGTGIYAVGGNLILSAPGDIWLKSGRGFQVWAGGDAVIRAKNSVDISTTDRDVRIAARKNMCLVSGHGGSGGMLIENKANPALFDVQNKTGEDIDFNGVVIRAQATTILHSSGLYCRTGGGGLAAGDIVLDAGKGTGDLIVHARAQQHYIISDIVQHFGQEGYVRRSNRFAEGRTTVSGPLYLAGELAVDGTIRARGNLHVTGGVVAQRSSGAFDVGILAGAQLQAVEDAGRAAANETANTYPRLGRTVYRNKLEEPVYAYGRYGNDNILESLVFSYRSTAQYHTEDFILYEDRWQQMARLTQQGMPSWKEKPISHPADPETYPYPGKDAFKSETSFRQQDLTLYDPQHGRSKPRSDGGYEHPRFGTPVKTGLNSSYLVIRE